jgi:serine/threonine protein kinase
VIAGYREPVEGTPFSRYQLIELLGRGGMGEVRRAHDTTIDRTVALKMLLPHFAKDPQFEKRFRRVDLQTLLNAGPLDAGRAVHIIEQIASALHSAHQAGLVHRDVKPSNILLTPNDFAYLIDFGIARATGDTALTSANTTIGTWAYMAPERFNTGQSAPAPTSTRWPACSTNASPANCPSRETPSSRSRSATWSCRPPDRRRTAPPSRRRWTT